MRSVRKIAECIGLKGDFNIVKDFFGYTTGAPKEISLWDQIMLLRQTHLDINIIEVGYESFTYDDEVEIDTAIAFMRDTFAQVDFGIGRVRRYVISSDDAGGYEHIADYAEAKDLTQDWTVDNSAMDVFIVRTFASNTLGASPKGGPESKDALWSMSGVVVAIEDTPANTGFALAVNVAHYLGLDTSEHANNLMYVTIPNGATLTAAQGDTMRDGPLTAWPCRRVVVYELTGGHW